MRVIVCVEVNISESTSHFLHKIKAKTYIVDDFKPTKYFFLRLLIQGRIKYANSSSLVMILIL